MNRDEVILRLLKEGRFWVDFGTGLAYAPKSNTSHKPLGAPNKKGYLRTSFYMDERSVCFLVHRLVWVAANGPVPEGQQIDHINGCKQDNRLTNLQAVTGRENMRRASTNGLTNGGWRNAPRDNKGRFFGKKATGCLLDGVEHKEVPA